MPRLFTYNQIRSCMATEDKTPESEVGSIECFQNYTAAEVFVQGLAGIVDQVDVESMIRAQKQMLQRFEKTNEMLNNCNALSISRIKTATADLKKYTNLLVTMKKDLNNIFRRTKSMREKLAHAYPQAYTAATMVTLSPTLSEEAEPEKTVTDDIPEFASSSSDTPSSKHDDESTSSDTG